MADIREPLHVRVKLVFRCNDHFLYLIYPSGQRDLPGGHIEFGEAILDTLRRELKEEMGYDLDREPRLVDVWSHVNPTTKTHRIGIGYLLDIPEQTDFHWVESDEKIDFFWIHKDHLTDAKLHRDYESLVKKALTLPVEL